MNIQNPTISNFTNATHTHVDTGTGGTLSTYAPKANPVFTGGVTIPAWLTSTGYVTTQIVIQSNILYVCASNHTSGTFVTDLASLKWIAISGSGGSGLSEFLLMGA